MKKLLIVTGAGASKDFGMPSVKQIDTLLVQWALELCPLTYDNTKSLYSWTREKLHDYYSQNTRNRIDTLINFENILFTIQNIAAILCDKDWKQFNNRINPFIDVGKFPEILSFKKKKLADGDDFRFLQAHLVDSLLIHFRQLCSGLETDKTDEIAKLRTFFEVIKRDFEIGFINLNYDNVILTTLPDLETGFDKSTGEFQRSRLYNNQWNFCYHLHGSVHFDMRNNTKSMHQIFWNEDLNSKFAQNSWGRNQNTTGEGLGHLNSSIITGLDKANQVLREPFGPYFMQLDRIIYEADAILFMGYGFSDLHLNSAFPFVRNETKKRKIAIIDYADDNEDGLSFRHDGWSFGVFDTVPFNGHEMGDGTSRMPQAAIHYKRNRILEKSSNPDYPLAVWYNGVSEACDFADRIKRELL